MAAAGDASADYTTNFRRLSRRQARVVLVVTTLLAISAVGVTLSPLQSGFADADYERPSDILLYKAEVARIQRGETYYQAAAAEHQARGYPTRSVFNWRTPLPMWLLGLLPDPRLAQAALGLAALGVLVLGFGIIADEAGLRAGLTGAVLLTGALMPVVLEDTWLMPPVWSGVLIALSACCYARGRLRLGFATGLAALFVREFALAYVAVCVWMAWRERRRRELIAWFAGLAAYGAFLIGHWAMVGSAMPADGIAQQHGWLQLGGAAFVISTFQMNAYLLLLPQWVTAVVFVLTLLGFAGWSTPAGERIGLTVCFFAVAFAFIGLPYNQYWGSMFAPLVCFGVARAPGAIRELVGVSRTAGANAGLSSSAR